MTARPKLDFWFDFASTYSYLAAMRIDALAAEAEVDVQWRPFLLGPIFAAQGWTTSPFNIYPAKGRNMWRDLERQCARMKLPLKRPSPFPQNSLAAARMAVAGREALEHEDRSGRQGQAVGRTARGPRSALMVSPIFGPPPRSPPPGPARRGIVGGGQRLAVQLPVRGKRQRLQHHHRGGHQVFR